MPLVPAVPKELRKEEKAQDRVQLHLPSAARLPVGVGQSFCLSRVNSHRAKSRGAGTTVLVVSDGLGTSDSACSEGSRPGLRSSVSRTGLFRLCSSPGK